MTKRVLTVTFMLGFFSFAANAASKKSAHVVLDNTVSVGNHRSAQGDLQDRMDWNGSKWAGNVRQRQMVQNLSGTHHRSEERYGSSSDNRQGQQNVLDRTRASR